MTQKRRGRKNFSTGRIEGELPDGSGRCPYILGGRAVISVGSRRSRRSRRETTFQSFVTMDVSLRGRRCPDATWRSETYYNRSTCGVPEIVGFDHGASLWCPRNPDPPHLHPTRSPRISSPTFSSSVGNWSCSRTSMRTGAFLAVGL